MRVKCSYCNINMLNTKIKLNMEGYSEECYEAVLETTWKRNKVLLFKKYNVIAIENG